jgi:alpha-galactosidase
MNAFAKFAVLSAGTSTMLATSVIRPRTADVPLASLDLGKMRVQPAGGRGGQTQTIAQANKSIDGNPIRIGGKEFTSGVGTRATSVLFVNLNGKAERFSAMVGADDSPIAAPPNAAGQPPAPPPATPIVFRVVGDGRVIHVSKPLTRGDAPEPFDADVRGIKTLVLQVKPVDGSRPVAANWADAKFVMNGEAPVAIDIPVESRTVLTPKAGPIPRINGPSLTGVTPGHDVLYKIPATGLRPITYGATNLPSGLTLDPSTGIIRGTIATRGRYSVTFTARNSAGDSRAR